MWFNLCLIWVDPIIHKRFNIDSYCFENDTVIYILEKDILKGIVLYASATRNDAH